MTSLSSASDLIPTIAKDLPFWVETLIGIAVLALASSLANLIVKKVILRFAIQLLPHDTPAPAAIVARLANIVPVLIVSGGVTAIPHLSPELVSLTRNICTAFIILTIVLAINNALNFANELYRRRPDAASRPIKGYIQVLKIAMFAGAAILIIAALLEQSPLLILSGLGAMAAVLLLVFRDTILSLVASVQLTSNDMLRVGDWIEMPDLNADGEVFDIALHTVKVRNWDKTITTIPTHRLISESYKNWRGMEESGGRRIMRALPIDQNTIGFLTEEQISNLHRFALISDYLDEKSKELTEWNGMLDDGDPLNQRRITNIGTFRAYVIAYLRHHPSLWSNRILMVRQLDPSAQGLPLQIYCFTQTTAWTEYEAIQADIFDHLIAILPEFGLQLFQQPSGRDFRALRIN
ncbi:mechanosensitive ion channel family protein [Altericroceibacterium spongiae]|uniref:Mechanosensing system component YbdG n=1 Tax=Altericroceibacterium spongiae TaxID=2320269 RepID=A0A420EKN7_9SPHN|nr:mechanosensitive ion channel domain-containing protein [Altericroceibacterium spongiae]RKF21249.1 mechanosensitive ion channel family protein [Altericroceibacterium spongiae]